MARLSLAKTPSAFEISSIDRCFAQAIRDTSDSCSPSFEFFSHQFFAFSARVAVSFSKTLFFGSNSPS